VCSSDLGDGAVIGAGSVVTKNVPPYAVIIGNPSSILKYRFEPEIIEELLKIKWWDWDENLIAKRIADFKDIKKFVKKYKVEGK
jgi:carbonic anhydrase/acetyltransferase-like protein (isoleucine patch superfamily)